LKTVALTAILFVAYKYRKKEKTPAWVVPIIALLTTVNISLAIFGSAVTE
jgi:paraquat-inducible protein B